MRNSLEHISTLIVLVALIVLAFYQIDSQRRLQALEQGLSPPVPALIYQSAPHP